MSFRLCWLVVRIMVGREIYGTRQLQLSAPPASRKYGDYLFEDGGRITNPGPSNVTLRFVYEKQCDMP